MFVKDDCKSMLALFPTDADVGKSGGVYFF